jgi:proteasome lid subunit RPN8/RPN11
VRIKVRGIARDTLEFILGVSRSSHPNEFAGLLQAEKGVIANVIVLPTLSSERSAVMQLHAKPIGLSYIGSVHSHPVHQKNPSAEDLFMFSRTGDYHIIVCHPYDARSWACYDRMGERIKLDVLDVDVDA